MEKLLDPNLPEIDLRKVVIEETDFAKLVTTCTKLRAITLGPVTDEMIRVSVGVPNAYHSFIF